MSIGAAVGRARNKRGLSQTELARLVGLTRQAISAIEQGSDPSLATLRKISRVTGVPLADLVGA